MNTHIRKVGALVVAALASAAMLVAQPARAVTAPDTTVTAPTQNQVIPQAAVSIAGGATDDVGINLVRVGIQDLVSKKWWDGTKFVATRKTFNATLASPGATSTTWTFNWTALGNGSYLAQVDSVDVEGRIDTSKVNRKFSVSGIGEPPPDPPDPKPTLTPAGVIGGKGHAGLYGWGAGHLNDGTVLIGDYWNYRITQWNPDGTPHGDGVFVDFGANVPTVDFAPYGLAVNQTNNDVWVADTDKYEVDVYDASGHKKMTVGQQGSGPGKYLYPSRVALTSNNRAFIADTWDNNIVAIDATTGAEQFQFGSFGTGNGQFKQPHGMDVDADNNLYIADTKNFRIQVFNENGTFLRKWGSQGAANGQFGGDLRGLVVDKVNGWVYVVDAERNRIQKFDLQGNFITRWGSNGSDDGQFNDGGREITLDNDGNVWVGDMPNFRAQKFSPTGQFLLKVPTTPEPPPDGGFNGPRGVAAAPDGSVFVGDTYNWRIQKFDPAGGFETKWGRRGRADYEFNYTRNIATDPRNGDLVVTDTDNHDIKKYDINGVFKWGVGALGAQPLQFRNPHGVDVGPDGTIYVADSNNDRVQVLNENGGFIRSFGSAGNGNGQFGFVRGITADPADGTIHVADSGRDIVQVFSSTGTYLRKYGTKGTADNQLDAPFDIEIDGPYVYVSDPSRHMIKIYNRTTGAFVKAYGGRGTQPGKFIQPDGLDIQDGKLYVVEEVGERVQVFTITT